MQFIYIIFSLVIPINFKFPYPRIIFISISFTLLIPISLGLLLYSRQFKEIINLMNKKLLDFSYLISNYIFSLFLLIPLINLSFINLTRYKSVIEQKSKS